MSSRPVITIRIGGQEYGIRTDADPEWLQRVAQHVDDAMQRIARVSSRVAQIQQDNLLDVHNFVDRRRIRMMVMEWIDGYDLRQLLVNDLLAQTQERVSNRRWEYINRVIVTAGPEQPRFKAGIAVAIVRDRPDAAYLDKLAIGAKAQGIGLGVSMWNRLRERHPRLYWRSRPENPVNPWYVARADGMHRSNEWLVFWYGIEDRATIDEERKQRVGDGDSASSVDGEGRADDVDIKAVLRDAGVVDQGIDAPVAIFERTSRRGDRLVAEAG